MPKVIITPNSSFNPIGVRLLLSEVGVIGPMLQDETTITCVMTEQQIERFRNGRGAAHKLEVLPDSPPVIEVPPIVDGPQSDDEPEEEDATAERFDNRGTDGRFKAEPEPEHEKSGPKKA